MRDRTPSPRRNALSIAVTEHRQPITVNRSPMSTTQAPAPKLTNVGTKPATPRKLFVNIPVSDLQRSIDFFEKLGFTFNAQFTDATATAMLVGEDAYFMLLTKEKFASFASRPVGDPAQADDGDVRARRRQPRRGGRDGEDGRRQRRRARRSIRRTTASCTAGASTIPTDITGKCSGWIRRYR